MLKMFKHVCTYMRWTKVVDDGGTVDAVSGLKYIRIMNLNTVDNGNMIDVLHTQLKGLDLTYDTFTYKSILLPNIPGLYAVILGFLTRLETSSLSDVLCCMTNPPN